MKIRKRTFAPGVTNAQIQKLLVESEKSVLTKGYTDDLKALSKLSYTEAKAMHALHNYYKKSVRDIALLVLANQRGLSVSEECWDKCAAILEVAAQEKHWGMQWRLNTNCRADLATEDIGRMVALIIALAPEALAIKIEPIRDTLISHGLDAILDEWLTPETRIHEFDGMGHNYWGVMVGAAAVMAFWLERYDDLEKTIEGLKAWMGYRGSRVARKLPNFSEMGDYREGYHYGEFAVSNIMLLHNLCPDEMPLTRFAPQEQWLGTAKWLKRKLVKTKDGYLPLRWGDTSVEAQAYPPTWHSLAKFSGDRKMLEIAKAVRPEPLDVIELLCWQSDDDFSEIKESSVEQGIVRYPVSGFIFLNTPKVQLATRAGEYWNHSHLDAGSFLWYQNEVLWTEDCGVCSYDLPDYRSFYVTAAAHNVTYVPRLMPPSNIAAEQGVTSNGELISSAHTEHLALGLIDTNILSGSALARSLRWQIILDDDTLLIWDDLQAYSTECFESRIHTLCDFKESATEMTLVKSGESCNVSFASDVPCTLTTELAEMGEIKGGSHTALNKEEASFLKGTRLRWSSEPCDRIKMGLILGTEVKDIAWAMNEDSQGWFASFKTSEADWELWFNPLGDGRRAHRSPISHWKHWETDAYALFLRKQKDSAQLFVLHGSFVRAGTNLMTSSLHREFLMVVNLD